jgi:CTP:molybdopterin cytidylyltransferase MocA
VSPHVVVTMAGLGSRFRDRGYTVPKFAIEVRGQTMFAWAMESLRHFLPGAHVTFVVRAEDEPAALVRREIRAFGVDDPVLVSLDHVTDGQATTVLRTLPSLRERDANAPLLVYNIDTYVEPRALQQMGAGGRRTARAPTCSGTVSSVMTPRPVSSRPRSSSRSSGARSAGPACSRPAGALRSGAPSRGPSARSGSASTMAPRPRWAC